jgi:mono/diheme cytochrome c family protein
MKNEIIIFLISVVVGLGGGYFLFGGEESEKTPTKDVSQTEETTEQDDKETAETESNEAETETSDPISAEAEILTSKNCLSCHAVSSLNLAGGATGPDLSDAYLEVEGKHGKPLNEFLKDPTSAVMASVISGNPLSDEEINQIVDVLKVASGQ